MTLPKGYMKTRLLNAYTFLKGFTREATLPLVASVAVVFTFGLLAMLLPDAHQQYILSNTAASTVRVVMPSRHAAGGTGFNVKTRSSKTVMLTNRHICNIAENGKLDVEFPKESGRFYSVYVREISRTTDLCITDGVPSLPALTLASYANVGEGIAVVGHPLLQPITMSRGMITNAEDVELMSHPNPTQESCDKEGGKILVLPEDHIARFFGVGSVCLITVSAQRTSAVIYPGNSGSPAVNVFGNVVGVLFAGDTRTNFGSIIPLKDVKEFLSEY